MSSYGFYNCYTLVLNSIMFLSAVHEAIGYLMVLATSTPKYLHAVDLIDEPTYEKGKTSFL